MGIGQIKRATKDMTLERTIELLWDERKRVKTITGDNGCEFHNYKDPHAGWCGSLDGLNPVRATRLGAAVSLMLMSSVIKMRENKPTDKAESDDHDERAPLPPRMQVSV